MPRAPLAWSTPAWCCAPSIESGWGLRASVLKSIPRPALFAAAVFSIILVTQFPASWCRWVLPAGVQCRQPEGSLWSGRCDDLEVQRLALGEVRWQLHPLDLLRARLGADLELSQGAARLRGRFALGFGGRIEAHDLEIHALSLAQLPASQLPRGLRGVLQARIPSLSWDGARFESLTGVLNVQGLAVQRDVFGDYQLEFPPDAPEALVGGLRDTGGPLHVVGSVRVLPAPGVELNGRVAARDGAAADLADQIRYLGSPDAEGMRPFSFAATF